MPIFTKVLTGGLAGAALLLSAGASLADPAQATASVNIRSGPGVGYSIVDQLAPGENVDVGQCDGGWCFVQHSGPDGWVSANYLSSDAGYAPPPTVYYQQEPEYVPAPVYISPPGFYDGHHYRRHFPHRHYPGTPYPPGGSKPPAGAKPPPVQHQHFPPGYGRQFQQRGGQAPGGVSPPPVQHQQFPPGYGRQFRTHPSAPASGSSTICATDPSAPVCSGGGSHRRH